MVNGMKILQNSLFASGYCNKANIFAVSLWRLCVEFMLAKAKHTNRMHVYHLISLFAWKFTGNCELFNVLTLIYLVGQSKKQQKQKIRRNFVQRKKKCDEFAGSRTPIEKLCVQWRQCLCVEWKRLTTITHARNASYMTCKMNTKIS